ncbi:hypothetical protein [Yoonia sediminilitoris]|uniref:Lipoprotein n=1 Tax=Yoonia sediminilitoris TaxID=1286148 RepID=A0A2T6K7M0_9RHOB|nr:hypothetical protein [Yoonia sediminilitoris]PUB10677.1 hypothetical protein C8N45_11721 [Yoonia sediminilitoris]RCW90429.1 hypothetical protein DFP92_11721 [Yoonia sediminilitoris]
MRRIPFLLPLVVLAACATPREQCIRDATSQLRILNALINETQGNLARGYAIVEEQEVRTLSRTCRGRNEDGSTFRFPCDETETVTTTRPVAIDLNAEQDKLNSMLERQRLVKAASDQAVGQCIATYPE